MRMRGLKFAVSAAVVFTVAGVSDAALASPGHATAGVIRPQQVSQSVDLKIVRQSALNSTKADVTGVLSPASLGRPVDLQYRASTGWRRVASGTDDGAGNVAMTLSIGSLPQWTARDYRLRAAAFGGLPAVTSPIVKFMPGPGTSAYPLGQHVLRIYLDGDIYPSIKGPEYAGTAFLDGVQHGIESFGIRGSSTARLAKKPYKIKFNTKFVPFQDWESNKRFNLLAMYVDNSLVRDRVGLALGRQMSKIVWSPRSQYVELFINDRYDGVYLFTDAPKLDKTRVDISKSKGAILETDSPDINPDTIEWRTNQNRFIAFSDPDTYKCLDDGSESVTPPSSCTSLDPEGVTPEKRAAVKEQVQRLEDVIFSAKDADYMTRLGRYADIGTLIDYYLIREFTKDQDSDFWKSNYLYLPNFTSCPVGQEDTAPDCGTDKAKFHFGPPWDFDRSAGANTDTEGRSVASSSGWYTRGSTHVGGLSNTTNWYRELFKSADFKAAVRARWDATKSIFADVANQIVPNAQDAMTVGGSSFDANGLADRRRWPGHRRYNFRSSSFTGEIRWTKNWYTARYKWIDANL